MSDTDTRTVAEIMGWTSTGGYGAEYWWVDAAGGEHITLGRDPSPDDMRAWLNRQGCNVRTDSPHDATEVEVSVGRPGEVMVPFYDDTLHAALEAAVRAVAEAER